MLFNSFEFLIFFPLVFFLYWSVIGSGRKNLQNALIAVVSYVFYGWWDWRFLGLIFVSSLADFWLGAAIGRSSDQLLRKKLLWASLIINLGTLFFFKYFNFFASSLETAAAGLGITLNPFTLQVILPVGISFYTFQTLSYTIDIYRGKLEPTESAIDFFAFVSFFPQLVAGPIERASDLLIQFRTPRVFSLAKAKDGLRQMLWGLFKKVVLADTCAKYADLIFANPDDLSGSTLLLGALYFSFQIYGDFSGYSDIALGSAKLMGFDLMTNFDKPYFSRNIAEFWQKWHISLSTWFRDYVYIPLGGNRVSKYRQIQNSLITFTISGLWHGANWTFVAWGFLNGLYYIPHILLSGKKYTGWPAQGRLLPNITEIAAMIVTFMAVVLAWVFFRSPNIGFALRYLSGIFSESLFSLPTAYRAGIPGIALLLLAEWLTRGKAHPLQDIAMPVAVRWAVYLAAVLAVLGFYSANQQFIYFQF